MTKPLLDVLTKFIINLRDHQSSESFNLCWATAFRVPQAGSNLSKNSESLLEELKVLLYLFLKYLYYLGYRRKIYFILATSLFCLF